MKRKKTIFFAISTLVVSSMIGFNVDAALRGRILLQVEQNGEAWYVDPSSEERSYMGRPTDAFSLMRDIGVGITNENIAKIQIGDKNLNTGTDTDGDGLSDMIEDALGTDKDNTDTDGDGNDDKTEVLSGYNPLSSDNTYMIDDDFAEAQAGKILIQVENNGEAWYVYPEDNKRYFLSRPGDAFNIMRNLGLGISNSNLEQVRIKGSKTNNQQQEQNQEQNSNQQAGDGNMKNKPENGNFKALQEACNDLSVGDTCSFESMSGETESGTCELDPQNELSCRSENMQNGTPPGDRQGKDNFDFTAMIELCEDLSEGDVCEFSGPGGETESGTCTLNPENELACRPDNAPESE